MLNAIVSPRTKGPWRGMLPPILSIVSDASTPQAELLALLAVPHSAMSVGAAWNRVATSVWWPVVETREWNCGTKCEMWGVPFVCLFHNPILVSIVAPFELGLGSHDPRFVAGPLEVGSGTRNSSFVAWPLELGLGNRSPRFVAWPLELGLGIRNARSHLQHNQPPSPPLPPKKPPQRYHHRPSRRRKLPLCPLREGMLRCSRIAQLSR